VQYSFIRHGCDRLLCIVILFDDIIGRRCRKKGMIADPDGLSMIRGEIEHGRECDPKEKEEGKG
jgi:hypothetical protein